MIKLPLYALMLLIVQVLADCEDADIATVLASRHDVHQLSDVTAS